MRTSGRWSLLAITLEDDDPTPAVSFSSGSATAVESSGNQSVEVTLTAPSALEVRVPLAVSGTADPGSDAALSTQEVVLPPGVTSATVGIGILDDSLDEADETLTLAMGNVVNGVVGAVSSYVLTIADDDATLTVGFDQAALTQLESGGPVTATVSLSAASGRDVTVPFTVTGTAADGADYALSSASPLVRARPPRR